MGTSQSTDNALTEQELQSLGNMEAAPSGEPAMRFVQHCMNWLGEWIDQNLHPLQCNAIPPSQVLMFIYAEAPEIERTGYSALETQWKRFFAGIHDQSAQGVVLCNENLLKAYRIVPVLESLSDAFDLIMEHLTAEHTFVVVQLSQRRMLYHLPGADLDVWCQEPVSAQLHRSSDTLSAAKIEADILQFHEEELRYAANPASRFVWVGKSKPYKLQSLPEGRIQKYLHIHLQASYKHLKGIVNEEVVGKGGRCDITVTWPSPPGATHPYTSTMLELKVLRHGPSDEKHRDWVRRGIAQASKYRRKNSEAVYTCVFDARKVQTDQLLDLDAVATAQQVQLRRYLMEAPVKVGVADLDQGDDYIQDYPTDDQDEDAVTQSSCPLGEASRVAKGRSKSSRAKEVAHTPTKRAGRQRVAK